MDRIEEIILSNLIHNEEYIRKVIPFIDKSYFNDRLESILITEIGSFFTKYNKPVTQQILQIEVRNRKDINDKELEHLTDKINSLLPADINQSWLELETEKFCKDKAVYNAILRSIKIIEGTDKEYKEDAIPTILSDALSVSFDSNVGHDYISDAEARFAFYHNTEEKLAFDINLLNEITGGGLPKKTLNCFMAGCVHPDTPITIQVTHASTETSFIKTIHIGQVKEFTLCNPYFIVEVDSPDGWVEITKFVYKGIFEEYVLFIDNVPVVSCNENHLFETDKGWEFAQDLNRKMKSHKFLTKDGYKLGNIECTGRKIPIVDIQVGHENHRYYTNSVSSHNTGVGKSLTMCHFASAALLSNKNVLYLSLEMSEEKISERIDANLLNIPIQELKTVDYSLFQNRIDKIKDKTKGRLIVKQYPTSAASVAHFRALLEELKGKQQFKPDIIFVDYLNICASARLKFGGSVNSYTYIKAIAEELRGLAVEYDLPIITATQSNRSANVSSDMDITDVSESFGLAHTLDIFVGIISTEELEQMGQLMFIQLKNRYNDINFHKRFVVGIDRSKMRLFDVESQAATHSFVNSSSKQLPSESVLNTSKKTVETSGFKF
jgi:hypothetical protein